jgi:hypothetical protein
VVDQEARPLTFQRITEAEALQALGDMTHLAPAGEPVRMADVVRGAHCFRIEGAATAVYVMRPMGDVAWVEAAKGAGLVDVTEVLDQAMTVQARGFRRLAMQTKRAGLVRKLTRRGWKVRGWIMTKELPND